VTSRQLELPTGPSAGAAEQRWTSRTELPLAVAAAVFLAAYAWPILQPDLERPIRHACSIVVYVIWALFALDYLTRLALARPRWVFFRRNLIDLASIALPVLRPLRLLRLIALVRVLNRRATTSLHGRVAIYVGSSALLIVFVAALAALDAERGEPKANINSFGDALWWAATTVMTVGYGDRVPVTATGRLVAVGLMLGGITLLGIVTASIATWLIARVRDVETTTEAQLQHRLDELHHEITELKTMVAALANRAPHQPTEHTGRPDSTAATEGHGASG
jgi:voltage-gated potassium channel